MNRIKNDQYQFCKFQLHRECLLSILIFILLLCGMISCSSSLEPKISLPKGYVLLNISPCGSGIWHANPILNNIRLPLHVLSSSELIQVTHLQIIEARYAVLAYKECDAKNRTATMMYAAIDFDSRKVVAADNLRYLTEEVNRIFKEFDITQINQTLPEIEIYRHIAVD